MSKDVALVLLALAAFLQTAARPPKPGVKAPGVKIPIERLKPEAIYEVPGNPDWLAIDAVNATAWVSNEPKNTVSRLDPKSSAVTTITVGKEPCSGLVADFGSLWVPNCGDKTISRVDLKTAAIAATMKIGIGESEGSIVTGADSVWIMTDAKGTLARIDPATNTVVAEIYVPSGSYGLAFGEGAVWVTSTTQNSVSR